MANSSIRVVVLGGPSTGKTTVAEIIQKALDDHGIPTELEEPVDTHAPLSNRLQALRKKELTATVATQQVAREPKTKTRTVYTPLGPVTFEEPSKTQTEGEDR